MSAVNIARPLRLAPSVRRYTRLLLAPHTLLSIILGALLIYLVAIPLLRIVWATITWQAEDARLARGFEEGAFTLFHWQRTFLGVVSNELVYTPFVPPRHE